MAANSTIEWTDVTWNPLTGCTPISPGCAHCYAAPLARRLAAMGSAKYAGTAHPDGRWTGRVKIDQETASQPLAWSKPRRVFVNSMSDLFHAYVPRQFIARLWGVMAYARQHTFQVLTKRAERMCEVVNDLTAEECFDAAGLCPDFDPPWPLANVWLGVSVESQRYADERIPHLLATPAALRFVSCEPLLGDLDLWPWLRGNTYQEWAAGGGPNQCRHGIARGIACRDCARLDWVIVGGESGAGARTCDLGHVRSLVEQCRAAGVACYLKQLGARPVGDWGAGEPPHYHLTRHVDGLLTTTRELSRHKNGVWRLRDRKGAAPHEWPDDLRVREFPAIT